MALLKDTSERTIQFKNQLSTGLKTKICREVFRWEFISKIKPGNTKLQL